MKQITHQNIPELVDSFENEDLIHIVMEFINGINLSDYLHEHVIDEKDISTLLYQVL